MLGLENFRLGKCYAWKMLGLENVRLGKCQDWKMLGLENVRPGKCQAWKSPNPEIELKEEKFTRKLNLQD